MSKVEREIEITNFDPIRLFLTQKIKLSPMKFAIIIFVADLIVDGFLGIKYNAFYPSPPNPGILQDLTALTTDFLLNPVIVFVYFYILQMSTDLYQGLLTNKIFRDEDLFWKKMGEIRKLYNSKILFITSALIAFLFTLNQVAAYNHWVSWKTLAGYLYINSEMSFFRIPFWFITIYGLVFSLFNAGITFIGLQKIFLYPQSPKLYYSHPDHCAGLGSIGKFISNTGFILAPISFWVSVTVISEGNVLEVYPVLIIITTYLVLVPTVFLWPIFSAHAAMVEAKKKTLLELSEKINIANDGLLLSNNVTKKKWEEIEIYQNLYNDSLKLPEWPFNFENFRRFFTIIGTSLIPSVGSILLDLISSKLIPYIRTIF